MLSSTIIIIIVQTTDMELGEVTLYIRSHMKFYSNFMYSSILEINIGTQILGNIKTVFSFSDKVSNNIL